MYWFCKVYVDGGEHYNCVATAGSDFYAARLARNHYKNEGEIVVDVEAELFNTFEHGDPTDYEIV